MNASLHDAYAEEYDQQMRDYDCYLPEVLFGLCYDAIQPGQAVLDAGIGSGLASAPFAKAGLMVSGFDFSPKMLEICQAKGFASSLKLHDILQTPWPYPDGAFDHLVCCGVLHFISDLEQVFAEAQRVLRKHGQFAFTTKTPSGPASFEGRYEQRLEGEFKIFSHSPGYVEQTLARFFFERVKLQKCLVGEEAFLSWVSRKK
jgi:predicted TPR repeat methyltransferase